MADEERKVEVEGANTAPWAGNAQNEADAALKAKEAQHIEGSVKPQLTEVEQRVAARQAEQAKKQKDEDEAEADAQRQKDADEKVITGDEANGIPHMDLLAASCYVDARLGGHIEDTEPPVTQRRVINTPEGMQPAIPHPAWEPGK